MTIANLAWVVSSVVAIQEPTQAVVVSLSRADSDSVVLADGVPVHRTPATIVNPRVVALADTHVAVIRWDEIDSAGRTTPFYVFTVDGTTFSEVRRESNSLKVLHGEFDPIEALPLIHSDLLADSSCRLFIVQFIAQPLEAFREAIVMLGATVREFIPPNAHVVEMNSDAGEAVRAQSFVRAVIPFHPAYRLERYVLDNLENAVQLFPLQRYNVQVFEPGAVQKNVVAQRIASIGGRLDVLATDGRLMQATLTPDQLVQVLRLDEVAFVDRWSPAENLMNNARIVGGGTFVESAAGYTGGGVRGEILDLFNPQTTHPAFQTIPPIAHNSTTGGDDPHPTGVFGILFGNHSAVNFKGMIRAAQGIHAHYGHLTQLGGPVTRYRHTCQLVTSTPSNCCDAGDTNCPYDALFQSNSWGSNDGTSYTTITAELDDITFLFDTVICQGQGNNGTTSSKEQAWAKNVVSVGGVNHLDTASLTDDAWFSSFRASIGPASDGRTKPDFTHFFDLVWTTTTGNGYNTVFVGTSAATPITCGHFGIYFQMWNDRIFSNTVPFPTCNPVTQHCVFMNRPHMTTAKAMMINSARQYLFTGTGADLTRTHQGWGLASVGRMYAMRGQFPVIVDETQLLTVTPGSDRATYAVSVPVGTHGLRATLVYADPPASPSASVHAVNDLDLKVTSPLATVYWGNVGLRAGNWSTSGGGSDPDGKDTVENVFVATPTVGNWSVEVIAESIAQDGHVVYVNNDPSTCIPNPTSCKVSSPLDADFALVVSYDTDCDGDTVSDADEAVAGTASVRVCCFLDGTCKLTTEPCCSLWGGFYNPSKTVCNWNTCPPAYGPGFGDP